MPAINITLIVNLEIKRLFGQATTTRRLDPHLPKYNTLPIQKKTGQVRDRLAHRWFRTL